MAKHVLVNLNFNGNQIENVALHNVSILPESGVLGQVVFLTSDNNIYRWNGTAWVNVTPVVSVAGRTGAVTLTSSDVGLGNVDNKSEATIKSDFTGSIADGNTGFVLGDDVFDALALKLNLSGGTLSGDLAMGDGTTNNKITNLANGVDNGDAVNKSQLDAVAGAIPQAGTADPAMDGTASAGSATTWSKSDHVHPTDTTRQAKITATGMLKGDGTGGVSAATQGLGNDYYAPAASGVPYADLASGVQSSLDKADAALPKAGGTMTGNIAMGSNSITGLAAPANDGDAATKKYVDDGVAGAKALIPAAEDTTTPVMDGTADCGDANTWSRSDHVHPTDTSRQALITASGILKGDGSGGITGATATVDYGTYSKPSGGIPSTDMTDAVQASLAAADAALPKAGGTMTGAIAMGGYAITGLADPTNAQDAATKNYADNLISALGAYLTFKGLVDNKASLPLTGNKKGDVYLVGGSTATAAELGDEYVWTLDSASGTIDGWEKIGSNVDMTRYALLDSPAFTGTPTAPTVADVSDSSTKIATTAFVQGAIDAIASVVETTTGTIAVGSKTVSVSYDGNLVNSYATMGGDEVILTKTITASAVTFTIAQNATADITCVVVSTKA